MALSVATEFIENEPFKSKQDCELNALYRLLPKIKSAFPQLRICIGGDSLYANKNVMKMIKKYNWKYIITNLNITEKNCFIIGNEGGRNRWKIENQGLGKSFPTSHPCCFIFFSNYFYLIF